MHDWGCPRKTWTVADTPQRAETAMSVHCRVYSLKSTWNRQVLLSLEIGELWPESHLQSFDGFFMFFVVCRSSCSLIVKSVSIHAWTITSRRSRSAFSLFWPRNHCATVSVNVFVQLLAAGKACKPLPRHKKSYKHSNKRRYWSIDSLSDRSSLHTI